MFLFKLGYHFISIHKNEKIGICWHLDYGYNANRKIEISKNNLETKISEMLSDKIFHVTSSISFENIKKDKYLRANNGQYKFTYPQSKGNWGFKNNMICLFDMRGKTPKEVIVHGGDGFYFFQPKSIQSIVFLLLDKKYYQFVRFQDREDPLKTGEQYIPMKEIWKGTFMPKVECWYPSEIPLSHFSDIIEVTIID